MDFATKSMISKIIWTSRLNEFKDLAIAVMLTDTFHDNKINHLEYSHEENTRLVEKIDALLIMLTSSAYYHDDSDQYSSYYIEFVDVVKSLPWVEGLERINNRKIGKAVENNLDSDQFLSGISVLIVALQTSASKWAILAPLFAEILLYPLVSVFQLSLPTSLQVKQDDNYYFKINSKLFLIQDCLQGIDSLLLGGRLVAAEHWRHFYHALSDAATSISKCCRSLAGLKLFIIHRVLQTSIKYRGMQDFKLSSQVFHRLVQSGREIDTNSSAMFVETVYFEDSIRRELLKEISLSDKSFQRNYFLNWTSTLSKGVFFWNEKVLNIHYDSGSAQQTKRPRLLDYSPPRILSLLNSLQSWNHTIEQHKSCSTADFLLELLHRLLISLKGAVDFRMVTGFCKELIDRIVQALKALCRDQAHLESAILSESFNHRLFATIAPEISRNIVLAVVSCKFEILAFQQLLREIVSDLRNLLASIQERPYRAFYLVQFKVLFECQAALIAHASSLMMSNAEFIVEMAGLLLGLIRSFRDLSCVSRSDSRSDRIADMHKALIMNFVYVLIHRSYLLIDQSLPLDPRRKLIESVMESSDELMDAVGDEYKIIMISSVFPLMGLDISDRWRVWIKQLASQKIKASFSTSKGHIFPDMSAICRVSSGCESLHQCMQLLVLPWNSTLPADHLPNIHGLKGKDLILLAHNHFLLLEDRYEIESKETKESHRASNCNFASLPVEIVTHIFMFLTFKRVCRLSHLCKTFSQCTSSPDLWRDFFFRSFPRSIFLDEECEMIPLQPTPAMVERPSLQCTSCFATTSAKRYKAGRPCFYRQQRHDWLNLFKRKLASSSKAASFKSFRLCPVIGCDVVIRGKAEAEAKHMSVHTKNLRGK